MRPPTRTNRYFQIFKRGPRRRHDPFLNSANRNQAQINIPRIEKFLDHLPALFDELDRCRHRSACVDQFDHRRSRIGDDTLGYPMPLRSLDRDANSEYQCVLVGHQTSRAAEAVIGFPHHGPIWPRGSPLRNAGCVGRPRNCIMDCERRRIPLPARQLKQHAPRTCPRDSTPNGRPTTVDGQKSAMRRLGKVGKRMTLCRKKY